jgi:hypothetical protein
MVVRGQRHAPAVFNPGKDPVPIVQEAGWAPGPVCTGAENLAPPGFDPRTVQPVASHYTNYTTRPTFLTKYAIQMLLCLLRLVSNIKSNICIVYYVLFQILCSLLHIIILFYLYLSCIRRNFTERKLQE